MDTVNYAHTSPLSAGSAGSRQPVGALLSVASTHRVSGGCSALSGCSALNPLPAMPAAPAFLQGPIEVGFEPAYVPSLSLY